MKLIGHKIVFVISFNSKLYHISLPIYAYSKDEAFMLGKQILFNVRSYCSVLCGVRKELPKYILSKSSPRGIIDSAEYMVNVYQLHRLSRINHIDQHILLKMMKFFEDNEYYELCAKVQPYIKAHVQS